MIILEISLWHIVIVLIVVLLLFGGKKIPELMKGLGEGMREFKKAVKEEEPEKKKDDTNFTKDTDIQK